MLHFAICSMKNVPIFGAGWTKCPALNKNERENENDRYFR